MGAFWSMTVVDWSSRLQNIILRVAPEYQLDLYEYTEYHYLITLQINDPERSTITFHVDRKGTGEMSVREWNPEAEFPELKAAIEEFFRSTQPKRVFREIPKNVLRDLERLEDGLLQKGFGVTWKQVEDYRLSLRLENQVGTRGLFQEYLVYFKNSGINSNLTSVVLVHGAGSFRDLLVEAIAVLHPPSAEHR